MKYFLIFILFVSLNLFGQTPIIVRYDYMETWNWAGLWWTPATTATWATNVSVSSNESAVIYGVGNAASGLEQDWYSMPNVTGLSSTSQYKFKFRLASHTFTGPSAATRGLDAADYVSVQVSTNGGVSYVTELRITGNSNSTWNYASTGTINHIANGSFTNSAAPTGDVYQSPSGASTTAPSTITLTLPANITQVAIDIYCRLNSAGEEWWIDNIELIQIPPIALPINLIYFTGVNSHSKNILSWKTASENNTSHFIIEKSIDGTFTDVVTIDKIEAAYNSSIPILYTSTDESFMPVINYYRLVQVDIDGVSRKYDPIAIDNSISQKIIIKTFDTMGKEINIGEPNLVPGIYFEMYEDGTINKVYR